MSDWQTEDQPTAKPNTGMIAFVAVLIIGGIILIGIGVVKPVAEAQADREASRAYAIQAQSQAQIQSDRERTERTLAEQQTAREAARLRSEQFASGLIIIGAILAFGAAIAGAVGLAWFLDRVSAAAADRRAEADERRHQHLLIYAAQLSQLPPPTQLVLPAPGSTFQRANVQTFQRSNIIEE